MFLFGILFACQCGAVWQRTNFLYPEKVHFVVEIRLNISLILILLSNMMPQNFKY